LLKPEKSLKYKNIDIHIIVKAGKEFKMLHVPSSDDNISKYIPSWPEKIIEGEKVELTVRQLCSHISGVRYLLS